MKWLFVLLAVCFMVAPAMAGEDPYIGIVGPDYQGSPFYFSPKHQQFLFDTVNLFGIPQVFGSFPPITQYTRAGGSGDEQFRSQGLNNQVEVCHVVGNTLILTEDLFNTLPNAKTTAGNAGFYEWFIRLPKKPSGEINIVIECGVLKPNALAAYPEQAMELCAAETGEHIGAGVCVRQQVDPGVSPVIQAALPKITATVYPGPFNVAFAPFHLTAFKNPSSYSLNFCDGTSGTGIVPLAVCEGLQNSGTSQVLDGGSNTRILLKACMDKTIVTKLPVTGQINALGETETDLEAGDLIWVRMDVPRQNTVDIYCHQQSVRLAGVGESAF
jgi:hypothetical protein